MKFGDYHGPLRIVATRDGAEVVLHKLPPFDSAEHLVLARFYDVDPWGGPRGMAMAHTFKHALERAPREEM